MLGPSPHIGKWVELEQKPGDKNQSWMFRLANPDDNTYIMDKGAWYFSGMKPEFDWKINRWNFTSDTPILYFYTEARS